MKNKMIASAFALIGFSASANAQVSAAANVEATIVTPIAIEKIVDLNFGNVAVSPLTAGAVVLEPASGNNRTTVGGTTLPGTVGTVSAARFTVTGADNYTYAISLSEAITIRNADLSASMLVDDIKTSFTEQARTATLTGGTSSFYLGATLNVAAAQPAGVYTAEKGLSVTVNYN